LTVDEHLRQLWADGVSIKGIRARLDLSARAFNRMRARLGLPHRGSQSTRIVELMRLRPGELVENEEIVGEDEPESGVALGVRVCLARRLLGRHERIVKIRNAGWVYYRVRREIDLHPADGLLMRSDA
jgi:hypothetical protein